MQSTAPTLPARHLLARVRISRDLGHGFNCAAAFAARPGDLDPSRRCLCGHVRQRDDARRGALAREMVTL